MLAEIPLDINCLCLLCARISTRAVKNTFNFACGKITVDISRPSATNPGACKKLRCKASRACLTKGCAPTADALLPISSVRIAALTSCPSK